jgi:hypothetical protein
MQPMTAQRRGADGGDRTLLLGRGEKHQVYRRAEPRQQPLNPQ